MSNTNPTHDEHISFATAELHRRSHPQHGYDDACPACTRTRLPEDDGSLYAASAAYVASQGASSVDCHGQMVREPKSNPWPKTPSMSRGDFAYIARIIASMSPAGGVLTLDYVAEHFAYHLADTNARFNRERFVEAATR